MPVLILAIIAVIALLAFLFTYRAYRRLAKQKEAYLLGAPLEKGIHLVSNAAKASQVMLTQAELASIKLAAQGEQTRKHLDESYEKDLANLKEHSTHAIDETVRMSNEAINDYVKNIQSTSKDTETKVASAIKERIDGMLASIESETKTQLEGFQNKNFEGLTEEIQKTKEKLAAYQAERMKVIDENSVEILEKALAEILHKQLSLADHIDLINQSIDEAKANQFLD